MNDTGISSSGSLLVIVLTAVVLGLFLGLGLRWGYRRAVIRLMSARDSHAEEVAMPAIDSWRQRALPKVSAAELAQLIRSASYRDGIRLCLGGAAAALLSTLVLFTTTQQEFTPLRLLTVTLVLGWPTIPSLVLALRPGSTHIWRLLAIYGLALALLGLVMALNSSQGFWVALSRPMALWLWLQAPASLLAFATLETRLRNIGPLLVPAMAVIVVCGLVGLSLLDRFAAAFVNLAIAVGLGAEHLIVLVPLVFASFGIALAYLVLRALAWGFVRGFISDRSLAVHSLWLLFLIGSAIPLRNESALASAASLVLPYAGFCIGYNMVRPRVLAEPLRKLLYLRVFHDDAQSRDLWRVLSAKLPYAISTRMITGPDLSTQALEAHEFLDYLTGKLKSRYIASADELEAALCAVEGRGLVQGRHPVHDLFCRDHSWRASFAGLLATADCALMDLRGFSAGRSGSSFEIQQLILRIPAGRILFILDEKTDRDYLQQLLDESRPEPGPMPRTYMYKSSPSGESALLMALCELLSCAEGPDSQARLRL